MATVRSLAELTGQLLEPGREDQSWRAEANQSVSTTAGTDDRLFLSAVGSVVEEEGTFYDQRLPHEGELGGGDLSFDMSSLRLQGNHRYRPTGPPQRAPFPPAGPPLYQPAVPQPRVQLLRPPTLHYEPPARPAGRVTQPQEEVLQLPGGGQLTRSDGETLVSIARSVGVCKVPLPWFRDKLAELMVPESSSPHEIYELAGQGLAQTERHGMEWTGYALLLLLSVRCMVNILSSATRQLDPVVGLPSFISEDGGYRVYQECREVAITGYLEEGRMAAFRTERARIDGDHWPVPDPQAFHLNLSDLLGESTLAESEVGDGDAGDGDRSEAGTLDQSHLDGEHNQAGAVGVVTAAETEPAGEAPPPYRAEAEDGLPSYESLQPGPLVQSASPLQEISVSEQNTTLAHTSAYESSLGLQQQESQEGEDVERNLAEEGEREREQQLVVQEQQPVHVERDVLEHPLDGQPGETMAAAVSDPAHLAQPRLPGRVSDSQLDRVTAGAAGAALAADPRFRRPDQDNPPQGANAPVQPEHSHFTRHAARLTGMSRVGSLGILAETNVVGPDGSLYPPPLAGQVYADIQTDSWRFQYRHRDSGAP